MHRPTCSQWQKFYGHPGGITFTHVSGSVSPPPRDVKLFLNVLSRVPVV